MNAVKTDSQRFSDKWETKRLGDIAHIKTGSKNNEDKDENGQYPLFVRSAIVERINSYCYDGEAILVPGEGGIGSIFHYINGRFDCHQRVYMINKFLDDVCGKLVYYSIVLQFESHAVQNTVKATVDSLRLPTFKNFSFSLPQDISEQRAIAEVLSDVDGLLNALEALIAKKQAIKQAVMQQLLTGKTRLLGFSGAWETKRLWEMGHCLRGVSYDPTTDLAGYDKDDTIRLLRANNIQDAAVTLDDVQYVEERKVSESQIMRYDDILICMANGSKELVGKAGLFRTRDGHTYTFGAFMGCFRVESTIAEPSFVFYLFQTHEYRNFINITLAGSSINNLKPSDIESTEFKIPDRNEQIAIAFVISDMDAEIAALEQRRDKTRAIKQGMMQQLLTGRVRLIQSDPSPSGETSV